MAEEKKEAAAPPPKPAKAPVAVVERDPVDAWTALAVRGTIVGTGLLGLALFVHNKRIFSRFKRASDVPNEWIRREIELKGKVREVLPDGSLRVEHEPVYRLWKTTSKRAPIDPNALLHVRLAALDVSVAGRQSLERDLKLLGKPVVFAVLRRDGEVLDADVYLPRRSFLGQRTHISQDLVRRGYARVLGLDDPVHRDLLGKVPAYARLVQRLLLSEAVAERRGVGRWERTDTWVEQVQALPAQTKELVRTAPVTKATLLVFTLLRDIVYGTAALTRQTADSLLLVASYIASGYRRFARGVDSATATYAAVRARFTRRAQPKSS